MAESVPTKNGTGAHMTGIGAHMERNGVGEWGSEQVALVIPGQMFS